jgi:NAD(P)-dependent dehydrogenase (short-subunit alcohol dehydrogenase family)
VPVALITGSNRGLGLEFVRQYCAAGWDVIACCRDPAASSELAMLGSQHRQLELQALDVGDFSAIDRLAATLKDRPIDLLLNNAGIFGPRPIDGRDPRQNFGSMDYDIWSEVLRINLMAPMKMAEAFVEHIATSSQKKLVAISSSEGSIGGSKGGIYAYRTSKAALNMLMCSLGRDLASRGIATAAFCPGWIRTRMGGAAAPLEAPPSIAGVRRTIDQLTPATSGRFWLWSGESLPW